MRKIVKNILFICNVAIVSFLSVAAFVFTAPGFIVFNRDLVEVAKIVTWTDWMLLSWTVYILSIAFLPITWISDGSKIKNRYIYLVIAACIVLLIFVIIGILNNI